jgi:hypothetical protein
MARRGQPLADASFRQHSGAGPADTSAAELVEGLGGQAMELFRGGVKNRLRSDLAGGVGTPGEIAGASQFDPTGGLVELEDYERLLSATQQADPEEAVFPTQVIQLAALNSDLSNLKMMNSQGSMSDSEMDIRLRATVKNYIDKYPGLSPEIRQTFSDFTQFDTGYLQALAQSRAIQQAQAAIIDQREAMLDHGQTKFNIPRYLANGSLEERAAWASRYTQALAQENRISQMEQQIKMFDLDATLSGTAKAEELRETRVLGMAIASADAVVANSPLPGFLARREGESLDQYSARLLAGGPAGIEEARQAIDRWEMQTLQNAASNPASLMAMRQGGASREIVEARIRDQAAALKNMVEASDPKEIAARAAAVEAMMVSRNRVNAMSNNPQLANFISFPNEINTLINLAQAWPGGAASALKWVVDADIPSMLNSVILEGGSVSRTLVDTATKNGMSLEDARQKLMKDGVAAISTMLNQPEFWNDPGMDDRSRTRISIGLLESLGDRANMANLNSNEESQIFEFLSGDGFVQWAENLQGDNAQEVRSYLTANFNSQMLQNARSRVQRLETELTNAGLDSVAKDRFFTLFDRRWNEEIGSFVYQVNQEELRKPENQAFVRKQLAEGPRGSLRLIPGRVLTSEVDVMEAMGDLANKLNRKYGVELGRVVRAVQNVNSLYYVPITASEAYELAVADFDPFARRDRANQQQGE